MQEAAKRSPLRVLIVDDNRDSADGLAMILEIAGHQACTAYEGEEGVRIAEKFRPDIALIDIGMPKVNGLQAARLIRQQPWGREMHLIAMTGWGQSEDVRRSHEAGFNRHVVKPIDPQGLKTLLAELKSSDGA